MLQQIQAVHHLNFLELDLSVVDLLGLILEDGKVPLVIRVAQILNIALGGLEATNE